MSEMSIFYTISSKSYFLVSCYRNDANNSITVRSNVTNKSVSISESESARYSIHLKKSITWSACGNGQKTKRRAMIYVI